VSFNDALGTFLEVVSGVIEVGEAIGLELLFNRLDESLEFFGEGLILGFEFTVLRAFLVAVVEGLAKGD
jgi:hypothetical protein